MGQQSLTNYNPTWRDKIATGMLNALAPAGNPGPATNRLVGGLLGSTGLGVNRLGLIDATPAGIPLAAQEAQRRGDYQGAALAAFPPVKATKGLLARGRFSLDYFGQPVTMLQNPTKRETAGFLSRTKYKAARRIKDPVTGDTYLWDAADPALHSMVAEKLGIKQTKEMISDIIGLD